MADKKQSPFSRALKSFFQSLPGQMLIHYFTDDLGTRAAATTYYLIFSIFPLLILLSFLVGRLDIDVLQALNGLRNVLPQSIISIIEGYLNYVQEAPSKTMLTFTLVFSIYFPWRVVSSLMKTIRMSYGQPPAPRIKFILKSIVGAIIMPLTLVLTLVMFVFGRNVILFIIHIFSQNAAEQFAGKMILQIWNYGRFGCAGLLMFLALGIVYNLSLDGHQKFKYLAPGNIFAIALWILASVVFSFYVENFARYSVIYGTLGGFIVLLLWLYLTSLSFILGGELNGLLAQRRRDIRAEMDRRREEKKKQREEKTAKEVEEITENMKKRLANMSIEQYEIMQRDLRKYVEANREKEAQKKLKDQQQPEEEVGPQLEEMTLTGFQE